MTPTDLSPEQILVAIVVASLGGGGLASLVSGFINRKKNKVEIAASVVSILRAEMEAAQQDAKEAHEEAKAAREEAKEARLITHQTVIKMYEIQQQAELLAYRLRRLTGAILDTEVSREELIDMARATQTGGGI